MAMHWGSETLYNSREETEFEFDMLEEVEVFDFWLFYSFTRRARIVAREPVEMGDDAYYHTDAEPAKPGKGAGIWKPYYKVRYKNGSTDWVKQGHISL